jgi:hypothetical protein
VDSRIKGLSRLAAAGAIVILASGLAACGSAGPKTGSGQQAQAQTPLQAIQLAADTSRAVNSFAATVNVKLNSSSGMLGGSGAVNLTGTVTEQLHPSLLVEADYANFAMAGQNLPGGMNLVLTSSAAYLKLSVLTQALHTSKQWIEFPFSELSKATGVNLGSLFSQLESSSPLSQSQLFAGATNVLEVGTGTINGVAVTEYSGTVAMAKALAKLPADVRSSLGPVIKKAGITSSRFTEWVDAQHMVRKVVVTEIGGSTNETITTTITSINQPVSIQVPSASQTDTLPASILSSSGL